MEAAKLGFTSVIVPAIHAPAASGRLAGIHIIKCCTIKEALQVSLQHHCQFMRLLQLRLIGLPFTF